MKALIEKAKELEEEFGKYSTLVALIEQTGDVEHRPNKCSEETNCKCVCCLAAWVDDPVEKESERIKMLTELLGKFPKDITNSAIWEFTK